LAVLANPQPSINEDALITEVEALRVQATNQLSESTRVEFGQFLTPPRVAALIAELFPPATGDVHLLEAGAGVGSLIAAALANVALYY
jgi:adenine-specific DNA-methyltransferase